MGPGALFYIFGYLGFVIAIGAILLKRSPRWRLTTTNLVVFVVSATAGMFALTNFVVRTVNVFKYIPLSREAELTYLLAFIGMMTGGILGVSIKSKIRNNERPRTAKLRASWRRPRP